MTVGRWRTTADHRRPREPGAGVRRAAGRHGRPTRLGDRRNGQAWHLQPSPTSPRWDGHFVDHRCRRIADRHRTYPDRARYRRRSDVADPSGHGPIRRQHPQTSSRARRRPRHAVPSRVPRSAPNPPTSPRIPVMPTTATHRRHRLASRIGRTAGPGRSAAIGHRPTARIGRPRTLCLRSPCAPFPFVPAHPGGSAVCRAGNTRGPVVSDAAYQRTRDLRTVPEPSAQHRWTTSTVRGRATGRSPSHPSAQTGPGCTVDVYPWHVPTNNSFQTNVGPFWMSRTAPHI
jgi:hypothetical protein